MKKEQNTIKRVTCLLLAVMVVLSSFSLVFAEETTAKQAMDQTANYLVKTVTKPELGSIGGEWAVLGLARAGATVPTNYYIDYYKGIENEVKACNGELSENKYTEYSRVILALTAIGKDVTNIGGYNFLEKLADYKKVLKQGINGPIFALIALDSHDYDIPTVAGVEVQTTRQMLVDYILSKEITDSKGVTGGFALSEGTPDPDVTGMALQALAKYKDQAKVKEAIERALAVLSTMQNGNGGYASWGSENAESAVQVMVALCELGIKPDTDSRFIKTGSTLLNNLLSYYQSGGGFAHVQGNGLNGMATEQAFYGLAAYNRCISGSKTLYDMSDVDITKEKKVTSSADNDTNEIKVKLNNQYVNFDQTPIIESGRTFVPMRAIFEALGAEILWDQKEQKVTGTLKQSKIELIIGESEAIVNGEKIKLEVPAQIRNGRTLVPVRFIAESLGADVDWDNSNKTVLITK